MISIFIRIVILQSLKTDIEDSLLYHRATKSTRPRFPITTTLHASIPSSLIRADDCWSLWAFIAASAAAGLQLEQKMSVGKALSGPVCSMLLSALATNIGILPIAGSPYISQLQSFVVKVANPLLLLGADLRKIFGGARKGGDIIVHSMYYDISPLPWLSQ